MKPDRAEHAQLSQQERGESTEHERRAELAESRSVLPGTQSVTVRRASMESVQAAAPAAKRPLRANFPALNEATVNHRFYLGNRAMPVTDLDLLCINTVRTLSMDAVQKADSGHPGTPMALAPLGYVLFTRDHATRSERSALARSRSLRAVVRPCVDAPLLVLCTCRGYDLDARGSEAIPAVGEQDAGPPRAGYTPGVETTTGPLGQGIGNAVGMAVAEAHLAAMFNKPAMRSSITTRTSSAATAT